MPKSSPPQRRARRQDRRREARRKPAQQAARVDISPYVVGATVALVSVVFWRPSYDTFGIVKLTALVVGCLVLIGAVAWRAIDRGIVSVPRSPGALIAVALVIAGVVATVASPSPASSLIGDYRRDAGLVAYACGVMLFLGVLGVLGVLGIEVIERLRVLVWSVVAATGIIVVYGLVQVIDQDPFRWVDIGIRPRISTLGQPNLLAGFLAITLPLVVWSALWSKAPRAVRAAAGLMALGAVVLMVATDSFQGPVAACAGLAVVGIAAAPRHALRRWWWSGAAAVAVVVMLVLVVPALRHGLTGQVSDGLEERRLLWRAAGAMVADRPVLGGGFGSYARYFTSVRPAAHARFGFLPADAPHDVPLAFFVSGGAVLGLLYLAFVAYVGSCIVRGLRRLDGAPRLLLGAFGGSWLAYQVQSLVSLDTPPLIALHFAAAAAIIVIAAPPGRIEVAVAGRQGRSRRAPSESVRVALAAASVVVLLIAGWVALRPLRADLAAGTAARDRARGDATAALDRLDDATHLASWEPTYWGMRAGLLVQLGRLDEALEAGQKAARRGPSNVRYALSVAEVARQLGREDTAAYWYRWAVRQDPNNLDPTSAAVAYFIDDGRPEEAVVVAKALVDRRPNLSGAWTVLGRAFVADDRVSDARKALRTALELDPENADARSMLATLNGDE